MRAGPDDHPEASVRHGLGEQFPEDTRFFDRVEGVDVLDAEGPREALEIDLAGRLVKKIPSGARSD